MVPSQRTLAALPTILYIAALLVALTLAARAQDVAAPAYVAFVDGNATLERDGQADPTSVNTPLVAGDRLRTTTGRIDVLFPDGTALDVDEYSAIDLQSPTLMRLVGGRAMLIVAGASNPAAAMRYQIDTPAASVRTNGPGEYRVGVLSGREGVETELAVLRGSATLTTERGSTSIRAGERSLARENEAPSFPQAFNSARFDAFDRWSAARRDARTGSTSRQYLPPNLQMYGGTFDQYGAWQYAPSYGYVWYPRVGPTWRPDYNGRWAPIHPYGWTWIGLDTWAWPTHHFGRWGFARGEWFWAPASQWAPAWVSWGVAPGYVSWCPLGFDNRSVFALALDAGSGWDGWVVEPRTEFGMHGDSVNRHVVAPHLLPRSTPFVAQSMAPVAMPSAQRVPSRTPDPQGRAYVPPTVGRAGPVDAPASTSPRTQYQAIPPSYRAPMTAPSATYAPRPPDPQGSTYVPEVGRVLSDPPPGTGNRRVQPAYVPPMIAPPRAPTNALPRTPEPLGSAYVPPTARRAGPVAPQTIAPLRPPDPQRPAYSPPPASRAPWREANPPQGPAYVPPVERRADPVDPPTNALPRPPTLAPPRAPTIAPTRRAEPRGPGSVQK